MIFIKNNQQECIPVGFVPPAHWPYLIISYALPPHNHACPPTMHPPPATTHTPGNHACPLATTHTPKKPHMLPHNHACPPATTQPPPPPQHACPWQACTPPATMHAPPGYHACPACPPCGQNSWHTLLKILPCPNFVAGGKNEMDSDRYICFRLNAASAVPMRESGQRYWILIPKLAMLSFSVHYEPLNNN